jgi:O-antigen/teichoic acid export membrane protein
MAISLGGVLLLTRLIGPTNYGLYAGALGFLTFLSSLARMGVDVYLVRREGDEDRSAYDQAFSFLLLTGTGFGVCGFLLSPVVVHWIGDPRFLAPLWILLLLLPLTVLSTPAIARLERALDYRKVASLEFVGQLLYYALALPLAWRGLGVWAPIAGYSLLQTWTLVASCGLAHYRPRLFWSSTLLREILGYGLGYSSSIWVWQLRLLVNPLIVGRYLGPEGVGYVALAIRVVEVLSFAREATWRISIAALARVQRDSTRLRRALEEAMGLQLLALGPLLAAFGLMSPLLLPYLFGDRWTPMLVVYPFIALSYTVNAVFTMHASVLYVLRRNWQVTRFHLVHVTLLASAAALLLPRLGLVGYGLAEVVALGSYPILHLYVARIFDFKYGRTLPWLLAFVPPLFFPLAEPALGTWALMLCGLPLLVALSGPARAQVREYWLYYLGKRRAWDS